LELHTEESWYQFSVLNGKTGGALIRLVQQNELALLVLSA
jgi:hypothetical protein